MRQGLVLSILTHEYVLDSIVSLIRFFDSNLIPKSLQCIDQEPGDSSTMAYRMHNFEVGYTTFHANASGKESSLKWLWHQCNEFMHKSNRQIPLLNFVYQ